MKKANSLRVAAESRDPGGVMTGNVCIAKIHDEGKFMNLLRKIGPHLLYEVMSMKKIQMVHMKLWKKFVTIFDERLKANNVLDRF